MKRILFIFIYVIAFTSVYGGEKINIAILPLKAGASISEAQIETMEDMLMENLFTSGLFKIKERSQLGTVITANDLYGNNYSTARIQEIAKKLRVDAVVIGSIKFFPSDTRWSSSGTGLYDVGEYVVDVRMVTVDGDSLSAAGFNQTCSKHEMMNMVANKLVANLDPEVKASILYQKQPEPMPIFVDGYLYIYPYNIGESYTQVPFHIITRTNNTNPFGYHDWRIPTEKEVSVLNSKSIYNFFYRDSKGQYAGGPYLRLVRGERPKTDFKRYTVDIGQILITDGLAEAVFELVNSSNECIYINEVSSPDSHISILKYPQCVNSGQIGRIVVAYDPIGRAGAEIYSSVNVVLQVKDKKVKRTLKVKGMVQ